VAQGIHLVDANGLEPLTPCTSSKIMQFMQELLVWETIVPQLFPHTSNLKAVKISQVYS